MLKSIQIKIILIFIVLGVLFFLLICLMFWGKFVLIVNDVLTSEYYFDVIFNIFCVIGYLFIVVYVIFAVLIFANKFPEKIKKFEKIKKTTKKVLTKVKLCVKIIRT